jgi:hypothetical protein
MPVKMNVELITENGEHTITLPLSQNAFDYKLSRMKLFNGGFCEYKVKHVTSKLDAVDRSLVYAKDIEELNYLAQLLDKFSEKEIQVYEGFINNFQNISSMQYLINVAYSFLGLNGGLYDDTFFPEYDYETDYFMKVKLSKPNHNMGVYVYLPANQSVIDRALLRLGVISLDECIVTKCSCGIFSSIKALSLQQCNTPKLILLIKKVVRIPKHRIDQYLDKITDEINDGNIDNLIALTDKYLIAN